MYKHKLTTPDWLCHPANISPDLVPALSKELFTLYHHAAYENKLLNKPGDLFVRESDEMLNKICPTVMRVLKQLMIQQFFLHFVFIVSHKYTDDSFSVIHVDNNSDFGLNIPVYNCQDSCTVWYDSTPTGQNVSAEYHLNYDIEVNPLLCQDDAKEIGRCDANVPHWINVNIPHRPMIMHDKLRINASLRFDDRLLIDKQLPYWVYKK